MHGLTANASKDGNLSDIYINEQGRIMFARFSFQYYLDKKFWVEISQCPKVRSKVTLRYPSGIFPDSPSTRDWNLLVSRYRSPSLKKKHLIDIYDTLYILMGRHVSSYLCNLDVYSSDSVYTMTEYFSRDYLVVGRIPVVPTEQAVAWELYDTGRRQGTPFRYDRHEYSCVLPADFARSVDHLPSNICLFKDILLRYPPPRANTRSNMIKLGG